MIEHCDLHYLIFGVSLILKWLPLPICSEIYVGVDIKMMDIVGFIYYN